MSNSAELVTIQKPRILLVEDDQMLVNMYLDKFNQAGLETISALEAEEGLDLVKKAKPNLIVLDILLPRENGIFFLQKLKENPETAAIPVIAFSNYDDPETKQRAQKLGVKAYLIKTNYTPQALIDKIKSYL